MQELYGKSIKDKRGGPNNIHSWDIGYKGAVSPAQRELLDRLLRERRKKKWAAEIGIDWMDGMPLTTEQIRTFYDHPDLADMLSDLTAKGYNIVAGKMSFEISKVLNPQDIAPTLVAMDMQHLFVVDGEGMRTLTLREGLRLFGYPDTYRFNVSLEDGYDLLGNTVVVPVIQQVAGRLLDVYYEV